MTRASRRGVMQRFRPPPVTPTGGLTMPKGPSLSENTAFKTAGFAQAADFYDSPGVCHHADYLNGTTDVTNAVSRLAELGIRHIRHGLWSPATHTSAWSDTAAFVQAVKNHPSWNGYFLWGSPEEPAEAAVSGNTNHLCFRIGLKADTNPEDTFLRALDGVTGNVTTQNWSGASPYYPNERKYATGTFSDYGWESAAGLEGPNEPDLRTNYPGSIRTEVHAAMRAAKNDPGRATEVILGGQDYIDSTTGRITPGPAYVPQLPISAAPITAGNGSAFWPAYGDYTLTGEVDVASRHNYWGGGQPSFRGQWEKSTSAAISSGRGWPGKGADRYRKKSYNGALGNGYYVNELPYFQTEEGWAQLETLAGTNRTPEEVAGEYLIRMLVHNYLGGARRSYIFSLNDISDLGGFPAGLCAVDWTRRASFYAVKNLLTLVGWTQGATSQPITVTNNFTTTTAANNEWGTGGAASEWNWDFDGLRQLTLQRDDGYLIILVRDRILWDPVNQIYKTVADPKQVTVNFPAGMFTRADIYEPAKNQIKDPDDGLLYSNPNNGTAPAVLLNPSGGSLTVWMAGLTRIIKLRP